MTELEQRAIRALGAVKMPERNWHASGVERLASTLQHMPEIRLPSSMAGDLWFLVWRYRRQVTDLEVVARANEIVNGALHLEFPR